jgi:hypothetical protein
MTRLRSFLFSFFTAAIFGPLHIFLHEIAHLVIAKLMGAQKTSLGYTHVDYGSAKEWKMSKQIPIHLTGPLSTDLICFFGLYLMGKSSFFLKMLGWAFLLPTYRSLNTLVRQFTYETAERNFSEREYMTDETLVSQGLGISKFFISVPNLGLSIWQLITGYRRLSSEKGLVLVASLSGNIIGTYLYIKIIGPKILPQKFDYSNEVFNRNSKSN